MGGGGGGGGGNITRVDKGFTQLTCFTIGPKIHITCLMESNMEDHNKPFKRSRSRPLNAISNTNMNCNYKVITVFIKLSVYMCRLELDSK